MVPSSELNNKNIKVYLRGDYLCLLTNSHIDDLGPSVHKEGLLHLRHLDLTYLGSRDKVETLISCLQDKLIVWLVYLDSGSD